MILYYIEGGVTCPFSPTTRVNAWWGLCAISKRFIDINFTWNSSCGRSLVRPLSAIVRMSTSFHVFTNLFSANQIKRARLHLVLRYDTYAPTLSLNRNVTTELARAFATLDTYQPSWVLGRLICIVFPVCICKFASPSSVSKYLWYV